MVTHRLSVPTHILLAAIIVLVGALGGCLPGKSARPRALTEDEKTEAKRIALSDPEVLTWIGDKEYEITCIAESSWTESREGKEVDYVFPAVEFNIPPDPNLPGVILKVFVDLKAGEVVRILSHFRKSLPPSPSPERSATLGKGP